MPRAVLADVFGRRSITLRQYDELITAPLYGFASAYDYYHKISSSQLAPALKVPCLAINSGDDPITGPQSLPVAQVRTPLLLPYSRSRPCFAVDCRTGVG